VDLPAVLGADDPAPVLLDCLAVWLDRVLFESGAWDDAEGWRGLVEERVSALVEALSATQRDVILVSNEVGQGIVPATASGRLYRDELGRLNTRVAAAVDEVWFCTAGVARRLR
jgi:adenosylcobinamide kinase/adenosylcobinamide-phosphate guanylyltransferase